MKIVEPFYLNMNSPKIQKYQEFGRQLPEITMYFV